MSNITLDLSVEKVEKFLDSLPQDALINGKATDN